MAGDWIKMRADLFTHPKVVRMASALKADTLRTVGGLMSAWCLFDAHSEDGRLDGYTPEVLDAHLRWNGFSGAMMDVGWLEFTPENGLVLPRFDTHNGQSAKRRAQDADRKRSVRKMSAPEADKKRTREEKRREDVNPTAGEPCGQPAPFASDESLLESVRKPDLNPATATPRSTAIAILLRPLGVNITSMHPLAVEWGGENGYRDQELTEAVAVARQSKPAPGLIPPNYLVPILRDIRTPKKPYDPWWQTEQATNRKGQELGLIANKGESMDSYRTRIREEIARRKGQKAAA